MVEMCPCGRRLHYTDPDLERLVCGLVDRLGEYVTVVTPAGRWLVSRHYIALHGLKATELPDLPAPIAHRCFNGGGNDHTGSSRH